MVCSRDSPLAVLWLLNTTTLPPPPPVRVVFILCTFILEPPQVPILELASLFYLEANLELQLLIKCYCKRMARFLQAF